MRARFEFWVPQRYAENDDFLITMVNIQLQTKKLHVKRGRISVEHEMQSFAALISFHITNELHIDIFSTESLSLSCSLTLVSQTDGSKWIVGCFYYTRFSLFFCQIGKGRGCCSETAAVDARMIFVHLYIFFVCFFCIQRVNNLTTRHNLSFLCALALAMRASTKHSKNEELIIRSKLFKWWWCNLLSRSLNMKFALITSWYESKFLTLDIGLLKLSDPPHAVMSLLIHWNSFKLTGNLSVIWKVSK